MFNPVICPLYGQLAIHWYGVMIALGVILFAGLAQRECVRKKLLNSDEFNSFLLYGIIAGVLGGKLGYILTELSSYHSFIDLFAFFEGGFSIIGTVIAVTLTIPTILWVHNKKILAIMDCVARYAPIAQAFGRIGCFLAGCCCGKVTFTSLSIIYTHPQSLAPLHVPLHPVQLYSALTLFGIAFLLFSIKSFFQKSGQITALYLIFVGLERCIIDVLRDDLIFYADSGFASIISVHQISSLIISLCGVALLYYSTRRHESV